MSNVALTAARKIKAGGPSNKAVLNCVADHANDAGQAWPSVATIADETELSTDTVRRSLVALVEKGLITREPRRRNGGRDSDLITLHLLAPCEEGTGTVLVPLLASCEDPPRTVQGPSSHSDTTPPRMVLVKASIEASGKQQGSETTQASPSLPLGDEASPKPKRKKPKPKTDQHELPLDWRADDVDRAYARDQGLDDRQIEFQERAFREHWRDPDAADRLKSDWHATWRKWILRQISWIKGGVANLPRAQATVSAHQAVITKRKWADVGSDRYRAWDDHLKAKRGFGVKPLDDRPDGPNTPLRHGYYFETPWPPGAAPDLAPDLARAA